MKHCWMSLVYLFVCLTWQANTQAPVTKAANQTVNRKVEAQESKEEEDAQASNKADIIIANSNEDIHIPNSHEDIIVTNSHEDIIINNSHEFDCKKYCGRGECKKETGECTSCEKGRKLKDGKCLYLGRWGRWSSCSASCGPGERTRKRTCRQPKLCYPSPPLHKEKCNQGDCSSPWREWSQWSSCLQTCGTSTQLRSRTCREPNKCTAGNNIDMRACHQFKCGSEVTSWSPWEKCQVSCGAGNQTRHRHCTTQDTFPCKQQLVETRNCPGIHPCPCGWCDWEVKEKGYTKDCLQELTVRERQPNCPAHRPPGENCTGNATEVQTSPERPGRREEIKNTKVSAVDIHKITSAKKFDLSCKGGCITAEKLEFDCMKDERYDATNKLKEVCGGKDRCVFTPDAKFFEIEVLGCTNIEAWIHVKCVGGTVETNHIV